ncbi:MAG: 4Fe-4S binding protein [Candidatus Ratteibacteria bacterium]|nr:4Fe-4S binding protein [Candidatus Ratteibacteria bacterium]
MFIVKVKKERCKGCGLCIDVCPQKVFCVSREFNKMGYHYIEPEGEGKGSCTGCQRCVMICPDVAIEILKKVESSK